MNDLDMPETVEMELFGHARRGGTGAKTYRKDHAAEKLAKWMERISFDLPAIAAFKPDEGLKALGDALVRKERRARR